MEKMINNGQMSVATSASEKIEKIASIINERHGVRADYTTIPSKLFRDYGIAWDNMPEFFTEIYKSYESGKWVVATEIFDNDYNTITKYKFESDYDRWSKKAVKDFAEVIYNDVRGVHVVKTEDNAETVPAEAEKVDDETITEAEDNNVYFTYNDIYEALNTILNAKSSKLQVELHEISDITDIPKSMCFYRQSSGNIGINFINYCDAEDPLAECYDFAEDYLRENASDIAFELSYRPFNDDPHPQTEDFYFKTEEYKKAEAEAVKALPF